MNTPDHKVVVRRAEVKTSLCVGRSLIEYRHILKRTLLGNGFDLKKRINKFEDLEKLVIVYEQKKYIIPKVKRYEEA